MMYLKQFFKFLVIGVGALCILLVFGRVVSSTPLPMGSGEGTFGEMKQGMGMARMESDRVANTLLPTDDYMPRYYPDSTGGTSLITDQRYVSKQANFDLVVTNVSQYMDTITQAVTARNGRVMYSSLSKADDYTYGALTVRVPVQTFETSVTDVRSGVREIRRQNITNLDETATVTSVTDQLQVLQERLTQRKKDLLAAKNSQERQMIQLDITSLEQQIAALQKQKENQLAEVRYATITVNVADSEDHFQTYYPGRELNLRQMGKQLQRDMQLPVYRAVYLFLQLVVFSIVWIPFVWITLWIVRRQGKKTTSKVTPKSEPREA